MESRKIVTKRWGVCVGGNGEMLVKGDKVEVIKDE